MFKLLGIDEAPEPTFVANACVRGMRHMAQAFIAACAGSGLTSNSGANGTGVDTADFATTGDVCRQKAYNAAG
jgi:hypothetical protein